MEETIEHITTLYDEEIRKRRQKSQTIFSICLGPKEDHLFACNSIGQISVFERRRSLYKHKLTFCPNRGSKNFRIGYIQKNSKTTVLACGGKAGLKIFRYRDIVGRRRSGDEEFLDHDLNPEVSESLMAKRRQASPEESNIRLDFHDQDEVNAFFVHDKELFAAGRNNVVKVFDLSKFTLKRELTVEKTRIDYYITDMCHSAETGQVFVGGNNSKIEVFDFRAGKEVNTILPYSYDMKDGWVSSMDYRNDWLICGGFPKFVSVYNTRMGKICRVCPTESSNHMVKFINDSTFMSCGREKIFRKWKIDGSLELENELKGIYECYDFLPVTQNQYLFAGKSCCMELFLDDVYHRSILF